MDLIKLALEKISRGHVTSINNIVVMRIGNRFLFGETINIRHKGVDIDEASKGIYELQRELAGLQAWTQ